MSDTALWILTVTAPVYVMPLTVLVMLRIQDRKRARYNRSHG